RDFHVTGVQTCALPIFGPLKTLQERHLRGEIAFWNEMLAHPDRDAFWQSRDILPHLRKVAPAVMVVGGLFDAEDLYGPLRPAGGIGRASCRERGAREGG